MKRILVGSFLGAVMAASLPLRTAAADARPLSAKESVNNQFVEMTYTSLCQRPPDPASSDYYSRQLNEGTWTYNDVRNMIQLSCTRAKIDAACEHVSASDLCRPS